MPKIISHSLLTYHEIEMDEVIPLAMSFIADGRPWHSHAISPGCHFNPYPDLYAVVVEDNQHNIAYISPSVSFPEADKQLVRLLHGDDILNPDIRFTQSEQDIESELLQRVRQLNEQGVAWHHHMNFPHCLMTRQTQQWMITVESDAGVFQEEYPGEPKEILRQLEVLYFRNLEQST
ncbi:hypothetical protein [Tatumella citrea]|uniref:Uncharacterized protein n=1 Tax=Tatumella citrea TaxID=53336 RepID=A0A1Y0LJL8_TATCI|nr:hypothetical protein [Tatumella citrea]ARU93792.1 hypothetical protein A7K98_08390 [Tatumella citrea]ARU97830.1 hypothetical protein A7K99_08390 [Tatumella citrea]